MMSISMLWSIIRHMEEPVDREVYFDRRSEELMKQAQTGKPNRALLRNYQELSVMLLFLRSCDELKAT